MSLHPSQCHNTKLKILRLQYLGIFSCFLGKRNFHVLIYLGDIGIIMWDMY